MLHPGVESAKPQMLLRHRVSDPANLPPGTPMLQDVVNLSYWQDFRPNQDPGTDKLPDTGSAENVEPALLCRQLPR